MHNQPQYMTLLVNRNGEEYGIFYYGSISGKYQSIFPYDLAEYSRIHDSVDAAILYISSLYDISDPKAFCREMVRQREYIVVGCASSYC